MDAKKELRELLEELIDEEAKRDHTCHICIHISKDGSAEIEAAGGMRDLIAAWLTVADELYSNAVEDEKPAVRRELMTGLVDAVGLREDFENFKERMTNEE